jgi:hypothetical protein
MLTPTPAIQDHDKRGVVSTGRRGRRAARPSPAVLLPWRSLVLLGLLLLWSGSTSHGGHAWTPPRPTTTPTTTTTRTKTLLFAARRAKKGTLGTLAKEGLSASDDSSSNNLNNNKDKKKASRSTSSSVVGSNNNNNNSMISPALAEWMTKNPQPDPDSTDGTTTTTTTTAAAAATTTTPPNSTVGRKKKANPLPPTKNRIKQSQRSQIEMEYNANVQAAVESLKEVLQGSNNLQDILDAVQDLLKLSSTSSSMSSPVTAAASTAATRLLFQGSSSSSSSKGKRFDYRLAWAGSDEAICHIGTGLHKVPLARLQEIFFSCLSSNSGGGGGRRIELLEVIRILGPFPNVRNTLQGTTKIERIMSSSSSSTVGAGEDKNVNNDVDDDDAQPAVVVHKLVITMDSMIDGTGKEIMAGTADNVRRVPLHLYVANENVIVAVVPPSTNNNNNNNNILRKDPMEANGANLLVFLKEDQLNEKLDSLRVS